MKACKVQGNVRPKALCQARFVPRAGGGPKSWHGQSCHPNPFAEVSEIIPSDDRLQKIPIRRIIPCWDRDQPLSIHRADLRGQWYIPHPVGIDCVNIPDTPGHICSSFEMSRFIRHLTFSRHFLSSMWQAVAYCHQLHTLH